MTEAFTNKNLTIAELLELAETGHSTIPSIQRPFVWEPERITMFIDSLLRGWPFGTMLFLKQEPGAPRLFPDRAFDLSRAHTQTQDNRPGYLVLDGQQRYQSIVLAFSTDSMGYCMPEKEWKAINCRTLAKTAANAPVTKYLCFNLAAYTPGERMHTHLEADCPENADTTAWLIWKTQEEINSSCGCLVPLYLTHFAPAGYPEAEAYLKAVLVGIRSLKVPVLEITPPASGTGSAEEQVVEIFTRLNTQGCPLTREQILGAKVKQVWSDFPDRLAEMRERLDAAPYHMGTLGDDDLVTGFNTLLKAHTRCKDISDAYARMKGGDWENLWQRFRKLTESLLQNLIDGCAIRYKQEYQSLHALWFAIALHHRCSGGTAAPEWSDKLVHTVVRWLMLGTWSKMWASRSGQSVATLTGLLTAGDLHGSTAETLENWMDMEGMNMKGRSVESMRNLKASARGSVRQYYTYLLVWMRLDDQRAKLLTSFRADYPAWQVDHILPAAWVKNNPGHYHELNGLGNCWLLNAEANVIKSDSSFPDFMKEFGISEQERLPEHISAVELCRLEQGDIDAWDNSLSSKISAREQRIMDDLARYINSDTSPELSYEKADETETHQVLMNTDDIYRGKEFAESISSCGAKTQHDYLLGVRRALQALGWNAESGPLPAGHSKEDVTAWLNSPEARDLENRPNLGNPTYRTAWRNYLKVLRGQPNQLRQGATQPRGRATRQENNNLDCIYRLADYMEYISGLAAGTQHDYPLGVLQAVQALGWNAQSGPLPAGSSHEEVTAWLNSPAACGLLSKPNLGNPTYRSGWKKYLTMLYGGRIPAWL